MLKLINKSVNFNKIKSYSRYILYKIEKKDLENKTLDITSLQDNLNQTQQIIDKINNNQNLNDNDMNIYHTIKQKKIYSINSNIIHLLSNHFEKNKTRYAIIEEHYFEIVKLILFFAVLIQGFSWFFGEIRLGCAITNTIYYSYFFPLWICSLIYNAW